MATHSINPPMVRFLARPVCVHGDAVPFRDTLLTCFCLVTVDMHVYSANSDLFNWFGLLQAGERMCLCWLTYIHAMLVEREQIVRNDSQDVDC